MVPLGYGRRSRGAAAEAAPTVGTARSGDQLREGVHGSAAGKGGADKRYAQTTRRFQRSGRPTDRGSEEQPLVAVGKPGEASSRGPSVEGEAEQGALGITDEGSIGARTSGLRALDVSHCKALRKEQAAALVAGLAFLEVVSLRGVAAEGGGLRFASSSIRTLELNGLRVPGEELAALLEKNRGLTRLDIRGCNQVGSQSGGRCCPDDGRMCASLDCGRRARSRKCGGEGAIPGETRGTVEEAESLAERRAGALPRMGPVDQLVAWGAESKLGTLKVGWGFPHGAFRRLGPALHQLRSLTLGLGAAVSDGDLAELACVCPLLEHLRLRLMVSVDSETLQLRGELPLLSDSRCSTEISRRSRLLRCREARFIYSSLSKRISASHMSLQSRPFVRARYGSGSSD